MSDILSTCDDPIAPVLRFYDETSYAQLMHELIGINLALDDTIRLMLATACPHSNNYSGGPDYQLARNQHVSRLDRIRSVRREIVVLKEKLFDQERERSLTK